MDNSKWAFAPDTPDWPIDAQGEKEKAVLLTSTFDSTADADMLISLLAAYRIPCFKYFDYEGGAGKVINGFSGQPVRSRLPAGGRQGNSGGPAGGGAGGVPGVNR